MTGIYRIRNIKNGKIYIGQSVNISHRWACHLYDLRHNRHGNPYLQRAYNKDPDSFVFEIICQCEEKDLNEIEAALIKKYNTTNDKFGYNISNGGDGQGSMSESTKAKLSAAKMGNKSMCGVRLTDEWKKHLSEAQPHKRKIICVETQVVYDSGHDAAQKTGVNRSHIVSCCTKHKKSAGGYHWAYYEQD